MNTSEYVAKVIMYYARNRVKLGIIQFDKNNQRFVIKKRNGQKANSCPDDGVHCGDVYIVQDPDQSWRIAQCEWTADGWQMLGSKMDETAEAARVLYVPHKRLSRFMSVWTDKELWQLDDLPFDIITELLGK